MLHPLLAATLVVAGVSGGSESTASLRLPTAREVGFVSLDSFAGKVIYVDVTRTTCARCDAQSKRLVELRSKYRDRGFEVVTVYDELPGNGDDPFARVTADAAKKGYEHPVALNDGGDFHNAFYVKIQGTPSGFLVTRTGSIESLGLDPLTDASWTKTTSRIEEALSDPGTGPAPDAGAHETLQPFTLLPYSGGPIRSADLAGKATLLVALAPGPLMTRLGPAIEHVQRAYGDRLRVIAVTFGDFSVASDEAKKVCPSVELAAPDTRVLTAMGAARLPQMLFLDANGDVAKRISTIYGTTGIEAAMLDRIANVMVGNAAPAATPTAMPPAATKASPTSSPAKVASKAVEPVAESKPAVEPKLDAPKPSDEMETDVDAEPMPTAEPAKAPESKTPPPASKPAKVSKELKETSVFRDEKYGYSLPIPEGFEPAIGDPEDRIQLTAASSSMRVTARFIEGGTNASDLERYRTTVVSSRPGYKMRDEQKLDDGNLLVNDEWDGTNGRVCASRLFVNTPKGILEVFTSGPVVDFGKREADYQSTVRSVRVDR